MARPTVALCGAGMMSTVTPTLHGDAKAPATEFAGDFFRLLQLSCKDDRFSMVIDFPRQLEGSRGGHSWDALAEQ